MKIFSAATLEHKEFSLIEFTSELAALPLINGLPKVVKLVDMFSLLNGNFVVFISCNDLKKTYESLRSHAAAVGGYFTNDTNMESLHAFYYLNKANISESLMVVETDKIHVLFEVLDLATKQNVGILDIKNQRSFKTNTIYLTAPLSKITDFKKNISKLAGIQYQVLEKLSEPLNNHLN